MTATPRPAGAPHAIALHPHATPVSISEEVQPLLQSRLLLAGWIFLGAECLQIVLERVQRSEIGAWSLSSNPFYYLLPAAQLPVLLWLGKRSLPLSRLRAIEAYLFGAMAVFFAWGQWCWLTGDWFRNVADPEAVGKIMNLAGDSLSIPWLVLMVIYGTGIPNSGRRCAMAVALLALTGLAVTVVLGFNDGARGERMIRGVLPVQVFWFVVAGAVAVYGSHKFDLLRREAATARKLGQYTLKRRLGKGGMGEVYLAEHHLLRRPCAIKIIRPEQTGDSGNLERFEREVRAMAGLNHPNAVDIYDYGHADDGTFYYAMEYLPGLNLDELVERHGPLPPERAVYLVRQVCASLREAHATGLVHRDVKPANVIVCERGGEFDFVKLLDFGLVRLPSRGNDSRLTLKGAVVGTPDFMSPEQAAGDARVDARTDLYSLGAVAYFLLTGQPVFVRDSSMRAVAAHLHEPPIPPAELCPNIPADLQAVVLRCLEKNPDHRYPDAASLAAALTACECADGWSPEQAAVWWQKHELDTGKPNEVS